MNTKEIGSVFHACSFSEGKENIAYPRDAFYYGCGRYAINALLKYHLEKGIWKRLFVPEYFCYEVIDSMRTTGIEIVFYPDYPLADDQDILKGITFRSDDVLLRMNYFGWRGFRDNSELNVTVIEDHSHDLTSDWASQSNADWCIASLRKTLPIPDGGILWTPTKIISDLEKPSIAFLHAKISEDRFHAMRMKKEYLDSGKGTTKSAYLDLFTSTEELIGSLEISALSGISEKIINHIPLSVNQKKIENYRYLVEFLIDAKCEILACQEEKTPFSMILLLESKEVRNQVRERLTKKNVYSNVLWNVRNEKASFLVKDFSDRMLSLPIDFRYSREDMLWMSKILKDELSKLYLW
jgi:hypothetical protein